MTEDQTDLVTRFKRDGFLFPVEVFTPEEAVYYRGKYEEYVRRYGSGSGSERRVRGNKVFRLHLLAPWAAKLVRSSRLVAAVKSVLSCQSLLVWSTDLTVKTANSTQCFGWHQDCAYADLGPEDKLVTAWVALSDSREDNGCVRFLAGSHQLGVLRHQSEVRTEDRNLVLGQVVTEEELPRSLPEVPCELRPGEASLHGWRTVHSSQPNTSHQPRLGLAIRYMCADTVTQSELVVRDRVSLVAGEYTGHTFQLEEEPQEEYGREEWGQHKLSMAREWERRRLSKQRGLLPSHQEQRRKEKELEKKEREERSC